MSLHSMTSPATTAPAKTVRSPYDWSLDQPGSAYYIEAINDTVPADLDPHLAVSTVRPLHIRLAETRPTRLEITRATMLGIACTACIIAIAAATLTAASIRLPQIEQQLANAARI